MPCINRVLLWLLFCIPSLALGQGGTTVTTRDSTSSGTGATNARFIWTTVTFGPATIAIGNFGTCTIPAPPNPTCNLIGGTGTPADPFSYACAAPGLPLSNCTLPGTQYVLNLNELNFTIHTHTQTASATSTSTTTNSVGTGATHAVFVATTPLAGPGQLLTGNLGSCSIAGPPYAGCTLTGGTGTAADPQNFSCTGRLALSNCTLPGTSFTVVAGSTNVDTQTHRQTAAVVPPAGGGAAGASVPLGPWVPIVSGLGIALLAFIRHKR